MALLKKIKSATLMETLTASVLIVIVFMMASLSINSIVKNTANKNTSAVRSRVKQLYYMRIHKKIKLPYNEVLNNWDIDMSKERQEVIYSKQGTNNEFVYP